MTDPVTFPALCGHDVGSRTMGSVIKKRRKRMAKKKHRKLLKKTRVQRRNKK
ncbi:30S ribosomal protein bS22 [Modestobacter excelsi]|uniref:30S ribosomal protein bS22 n=1 Tax=Modestobacter excelsi TaxID=2213161 RepID=UPI003F6DC931